MTPQSIVTNGYRNTINRLERTDWMHAAGVLFAIQFAAALWFFSLLVYTVGPGSNTADLTTFTPGAADTLETMLVSALVGFVLAPPLYVYLRVLAPRLPTRRAVAETVGLWVLTGPVVFVAVLVWTVSDIGLSATVDEMTANPWLLAQTVAMLFFLAALLAVLVGGVYALATGSIRPSSRQRRVLIGVGAALILVPVAVGVVFPMDGGESPGINDTDDSAWNDTDDSSSNVSFDTPDPADPDAYDTNDSPYINHAVSVPGESGVVALNCNGPPERPPGNETWDYPVATTHTDAAAVTVSNLTVDTENGTIVPRAHYHFDIDANASADRVISLGAYAETGSAEYSPVAWRGTVVGLEPGVYLEMPRSQSVHVYIDVVNDDGEIERYIVEVCREDVDG